MPKGNVLISGASFAGLATAFWMIRAGYEVTVVEVASALREGGTPVNVKGDTIGIIDRMGLLDEVVANKIEINNVVVWGPQGRIASPTMQASLARESNDVEYEIERDLLTRLMFDLVKNDIEIIFDDSAICLNEEVGAVGVDFQRGKRRTFALVFGCDGIHSTVRNLWFGDTVACAHFLKTYGSVTIIPRLLIEQGSLEMYQAPGRSVILSAYNGKTDIITLFSSNAELNYDRRNRTQQQTIVADYFKGMEWRIPELLREIEQADNFYFSDLSQIRMTEWTRGRVALIGDAAYCLRCSRHGRLFSHQRRSCPRRRLRSVW